MYYFNGVKAEAWMIIGNSLNLKFIALSNILSTLRYDI